MRLAIYKNLLSILTIIKKKDKIKELSDKIKELESENNDLRYKVLLASFENSIIKQSLNNLT